MINTLAGVAAAARKFFDIEAGRRGIGFSPQQFGAGSVTPPPGTDETSYVAAAIAAAYTANLPVVLDRLYRVSNLEIGNTAQGLTIRGPSGIHQKRGTNPIGGFMPVGDGQSCLISCGRLNSGGTGYFELEQFLFEEVTFFGEDRSFTKGLVHTPGAKQGDFRFCSFRRARAPAVYAPRLEDVNFDECRFMLLGGSDGKAGGICFADLPVGATIGSNAVYIKGGRFEFIDGPHIGIDPAATTAWASSVFVTNAVKFECGDHTTSNDGANATYGSNRGNYPVFDFRAGAMEATALGGNRTSVRISNYFISRADEADYIAAIGPCDDFVFDGGFYSASSTNPIKLLRVRDVAGVPCNARNLIYRNHHIRETGGVASISRSYVFDNANLYPATIELPLDDYRSGALNLINRGADSFLPLSLVGAPPSGTGGTSTGRRMVADPAPTTDPCLSPHGSVMAVYNSSATDIANLSAAGLTAYGVLGLSAARGGRARVWVRCKAADNTKTRVVRLDDDGGTVVTSANAQMGTTWSWIPLDVDLSARTGPLRLRGQCTTDQILYIDGIRIQTIDYIEVSATYNPPSIASGASTSTTITVTGVVVGDSVTVFPPTGYTGGLQGVRAWADVTAADTVTLYLRNDTGGAIDLASGAWKVRVAKNAG